MFKKSKEVATIEMVHHDFDTAVDRIMSEVDNILNSEGEINGSLADNLAAIGFKNAKGVKETQALRHEKNEAAIIAKAIREIQIHYPAHKIITKSEMKDICAKYGLVYGEVRYYTGNIPKDKAEEILDFCVGQVEISRKKVIANVTDFEADMLNYKMRNNIPIPTSKYRVFPTAIPNKNYGDQGVDMSDVKLDICAQPEMFDMDKANLEIVEGELTLIDKDPVVLAKMRHFPMYDEMQRVTNYKEELYLIVSKWGAEADFTEFHDEREN